MRSIKFQFVALGALFALFGVGALAQMYYGQQLQNRVMEQIKGGHDLVNAYLLIERQEVGIIADLDALVSAQGGVPQSLEAANLATTIDAWAKAVHDWDGNYSRWLSQSGLSPEIKAGDQIISGGKRRQAEAYKTALKLYAKGDAGAAADILKMETNYFLAAQKTIIDIFTINVRNKLTEASSVAIRFFISTFFAVLLAVFAIGSASFLVFRDITKNLKALEGGADAISRGVLDNPINVAGPAELRSLAESFNHMQTAIRSRDQQIRLNHEEIKKLNEELQGKLVASTKTIEGQNDTLLRKNKELEQILYTATHDLRTPLISIQGFAEELKLNCDDLKTELDQIPQEAVTPRAREILEDELKLSLNYILNGAKRMDGLLDGLLRLSRMGRASVKPERLDLDAMLRNVVDSLNFQLQESGASVKPDKLLPCTGDASMVEQVFQNLISNAIKYRSPDRPCQIAIKSIKNKGQIVYSIRDNGIGISKDNQKRIFDAFYRVTKEDGGGEGLGLAIVSRIIDLHNGKIWLESEEGKGSCFYLQLPA